MREKKKKRAADVGEPTVFLGKRHEKKEWNDELRNGVVLVKCAADRPGTYRNENKKKKNQIQQFNKPETSQNIKRKEIRLIMVVKIKMICRNKTHAHEKRGPKQQTQCEQPKM